MTILGVSAPFLSDFGPIAPGPIYANIKDGVNNDVTQQRPTIILIDDDPSILRALRRLVAGAGFDVRTFDRPSTLLKSDLPTAGCLVVDIDLPEMNGVELCATLAASGCGLPVILITAHTDEETRRLADDAHPVALLIKPFGRDLLVNSIRSALLAGENC